MLDLVYVARLDFLAHIRALASKRAINSDNRFVPAKPPVKDDGDAAHRITKSKDGAGADGFLTGAREAPPV